MVAKPDRSRARGRAPVAQAVCAAVGVVFLVVGIIGLTQTGFSGFDGHQQGTVGGLGGTTLLNLVHTILGGLALIASRTNNGARAASMLGALAFLALTTYGVVSHLDDSPDEPLGLQWPATVLHIAGGLAAVFVVWSAGRASRDRTESAA